MIDWNNYRRADKSIDLLAVWEDCTGGASPGDHSAAAAYLKLIESMQPIMSRQAAAIALASWRSLTR